MPTKFSWHWGGRTPDPTAVARREARGAAEGRLLALQQPWSEGAHARRKAHEGAELYWSDTAVKPLAKKIEARVADCRSDEDRLKLAEEILEGLRQGDRGFVRGGGATMAAVIDASETIRDFLVQALIINSNTEMPRRPG
jgi:hypothetical protein